MNNPSLTQSVLDYALLLEADFSGIADLTPALTAIAAQGGPELARYPRAVSMGIRLMDSIVDRLPSRADAEVRISYRHHAYDVVNARLDEMAARMASHLQRFGFLALPIPASKRAENNRLYAAFSHKIAAHLAGLGWIGKSCLLITPQAGPRVRWTTVLTDAPLQAASGPIEPGCGECNACVDICPVEAFTGRLFDPSEPREARFDAARCDEYLRSLEKTGPSVCGMCLYVCPYGRNSLRA